MAKDPAFLFYSQDFSIGTQFFTDEQVGKYIRLLCAQHQHGHLSEKHMLSICKAYDEDVLSKFTKDGAGNYYNVRLENEVLRRKTFTDSRRINAQQPKKQRIKHRKAYAKPYAQHMENENEIENTSISFTVFWDLYDKKKGEKDKIEVKWNTLTEDVKAKIIEYIPKYKEAQPDKQYRKDPSTFLNQKAWEDEIIPRQNPPQNGTVKNIAQARTNPRDAGANQALASLAAKLRTNATGTDGC